MKSSRHWLYLTLASGLLVIGATLILTGNPAEWFSQETASQQGNDQEFHIVTGEFKTTADDGQEHDVYRFSPGHLTVNKGDQVTLHIHGVNGHAHDFEIEAFGVNGTVERGDTATVSFHADQAGTFELVCTNHDTLENGGPMIGYLTVME